MQETTNCKNPDCGALVYVTDVPSKKSGFCWRCEVKRLNSHAHNLKAHIKGHEATNLQLVEEVKDLKERLQALHAECMGHIADKSHLSGEVERWKDEYENLCTFANDFEAQIAQLKGESERLRYTAFETCHRMQLIVLYYGRPEVQAAIDAWLEPDEDGGSDWFNPPPGVDENLEKLEHFKESLQQMFPDLFPEPQ